MYVEEIFKFQFQTLEARKPSDAWSCLGGVAALEPPAVASDEKIITTGEDPERVEDGGEKTKTLSQDSGTFW